MSVAKTELNLEKYSNDGWGLSERAFQSLINVMDTLPEIIAIEFGSGISTEFLEDYAAESGKNLHIDSFDNDAKYKHEKAHLVGLVECNDKKYRAMFDQGKIDWDFFKKRWWKPKTRQKNCFYDIRDFTLKKNYNLAIIDGPHGNGRNFAFLVLKDCMPDGYILIDDFNHYDFLETASKLLKIEEVARVEAHRDNYVLLKKLES